MIIQCEVCKKEFYKRPSHFKRVKHQFCSRACRGIAHRGDGNPAWKDNYLECLNCYVKFKPNSKDTKFCSQRCMGEWKHKTRSIVSECEVCGAKMNIILAKIGTKRFCSMKCKNSSHAIDMEGKGNPAWLGGINNPYDTRFNKRLKIEIKKEFGYKCFECGEQKLLQVHHIDYNKENSVKENLVPLCCSCHCKTNYNRDIWKEKLSKKLQEWRQSHHTFII